MNPDDFSTLLDRHAPPIARLTKELTALIGTLRPDLSAAVKLRWGSVNYRHARAGLVCALFPRADHVALYFEHGSELSHPLLEGKGQTRQVRFIRLLPGKALPVDDIAILLAEAVALRA